MSVFASLLFVIAVARRLSVEEFGIWTMIFRYMSYVLPFMAIYNYWLPRTISRGINTAKIGILLAIAIGGAASVAYVGIAYGVSTLFNQPLTLLVLALFILFQDYINGCLKSISIAHAPQYVGIAHLTLRIVQAALGILLVAFYRFGLYGAVISAIIGRTAMLAMLLVLNRKVISRSRIDMDIAKTWLRRSWLPIYNNIPLSILALDVVIIRTFSGTEEPIAYYGISLSLLGLAIASLQVMPALYSKLLAKRDMRDVIEAFWIAYMLSIPMMVGLLVYMEPILAVYNMSYVAASQVIRLFVAASILRLFVSLLGTTLSGLEYRDYEVTDIGLIRTVLFKTPTLSIVVTFAYLAALTIVSSIVHGDIMYLTMLWGVLYLTRLLVLTISYNYLLKKEFSIVLPYKELLKFIAKFCIASLVIIINGILIYPVRPQPSIYALVSDLAPAIAISAAMYFAVLYLIDSKMRNLIRSVIIYLRKTTVSLPT
ncbi:MAG: hypothetical protein DRO15_01110 [Thermoprotei archaeon]|nr:MAG: hypothetical protein DRO15_01110 [Thermoprotei archaeon]